LLTAGYAVVTKEYSAGRASRLVQSVTQWVDDPDRPGRQLGWVQEESLDYVRPVRRLAVRAKKSNGQWYTAVLLVAGLEHRDILTLMGQPLGADEATIMGAYAHFYDQRGGGIETSFGEDKGGLGITKRNKKRFEAQRLLMLLGTLAHNLLIWSRRWLCRRIDPHQALRLQQYGIKRLIRDLYHISGKLSFERNGRLRAIALTPSSSLAKLMLVPLQKLLALAHIAVSLDET
ncbi:MAG TPA: transposase, partial [Ktedonobacteraceae bacterium]|nr:transposase [Ktedonobacteraceae bacterium]